MQFRIAGGGFHKTETRLSRSDTAHRIFWFCPRRRAAIVPAGIQPGPRMKIINWFQIPAADLDRAVKFYQAVLGVSFHRLDDPVAKHAFFTFDTMETLRTGGEIIQSSHNQPAASGTLIYLNAPGGVDAVLAKIEPAGGKILMPKTSIGENGVIAIIRDTEGNRIGLHSV